MRRWFLVAFSLLILPWAAFGQDAGWDANGVYIRAQHLVDEGRIRQGLALFLQIRERAPHFRPLRVQRSICCLYERVGDIHNALKECEAFVEKYPWARGRFQMLMRMAAMAEVALHDLDRAWGYLEMIPEDKVPPGDMAPYLFNKGYLLEKMGKTQDALCMYRRLVKDYPDSVGALWAKERIEELGSGQGNGK